MQQTAVMKYLHSKRNLILEAGFVVLLLLLVYSIEMLNALSLRLIVFAYLCNVIQAILYRNNQVSRVFIVIVLRGVGLVALIEAPTSSVFVFSAMAIALFLLNLNTEQYSSNTSYLRKRAELGVIATTAVFNEQLVRVSGGLDYELSLILLSVGYIISFVSIGQQTLLQYFYTDKAKNNIDHYLSLKNLFLLILLSFSSISVLIALVGIEDVVVIVMIYMMIVSNLMLRFTLLIDNIKDRKLNEYIFLNVVVLTVCFLLLHSEYSIYLIQIVSSTLILIFTMKKILCNTYK